MPLVVDQPIWPPWVLTMPNRQELGLLTYSVAQGQVRLVGHRVWDLITCLTWVNGLTGHNQWNYNGLTDLSATCWCVYTSRPSCNLSKPWVWVNIPTSWQKILHLHFQTQVLFSLEPIYVPSAIQGHIEYLWYSSLSKKDQSGPDAPIVELEGIWKDNWGLHVLSQTMTQPPVMWPDHMYIVHCFSLFLPVRECPSSTSIPTNPDHARHALPRSRHETSDGAPKTVGTAIPEHRGKL